MIVEGVGIGVGADGFGGYGVVVWFADVVGVVGAGAAIGWCLGFGACGEAGIECGTLDVAVGVGVDAIAGFGGLRYLEVPGTPGHEHFVCLRRFVGQREGGIHDAAFGTGLC